MQKRPVGSLPLPIIAVRPMSFAPFNFPGPVSIEIHKCAMLETPNIFTTESTGLMGGIMKNGSCYPKKCVFAKKRLVGTWPIGRRCHYDGSSRPFILPNVHTRIITSNPVPRQRRTTAHRNLRGEVGSSNAEVGQAPDDSEDTARSVGTLSDNTANSDDERADDVNF